MIGDLFKRVSQEVKPVTDPRILGRWCLFTCSTVLTNSALTIGRHADGKSTLILRGQDWPNTYGRKEAQ